MKIVEEEISKIIDNKQIKIVFQPIISLRDGSILGHEALSIAKNNIVLGIVSKARFTIQLNGRYGFSLYQNKAISTLMETDFLTVDSQTPINAVTHIAMSRPADKLYDFILVTKNDEYLGTVTIKDLLQKTTEIEVVNAKHQNPLSGLPGNIIIEQKMYNCSYYK